MSAKKHAKKVVVLGVGPEYQAVYEEGLNGHKVIFATSTEEALAASKTADIIAVNIDSCGDFLDKVFGRGYEGKVVTMTNSRKSMEGIIKLPNGEGITSVSRQAAPKEIMRVLNA